MTGLLHYVLEGAGEPVLLLHPVGLDLASWDAVAARLRERFRVLRVDLRGHGRSADAPAGHDLEGYAGDVHQLLAALSFAPATVVGLSFGGMVAQALALAHPGDVARLVLCGCPCEFPDDARAGIAQRGEVAQAGGMAAVVDATMQRWFNADHLTSDAATVVRQRLLADSVSGWATAWQAISRLATASQLHRIDVPTLCIAGGRDAAIAPDMTRRIAERIPGARFELLAGAPHMMQIEQPAEMAAAIDRFIAETAADTRRAAEAPSGSASMFDQGLAMRRAVLGAAHVDRSLAAADQYTRPLQELVTEYCWGAVWTRPGLSLQFRSLLNIGMLTALNRPHELRIHLRGALTNGCTREEIVETLLQTAVYCGAPAALESTRIAREVFREIDETAPVAP